MGVKGDGGEGEGSEFPLLKLQRIAQVVSERHLGCIFPASQQHFKFWNGLASVDSQFELQRQ